MLEITFSLGIRQFPPIKSLPQVLAVVSTEGDSDEMVGLHAVRNKACQFYSEFAEVK